MGTKEKIGALIILGGVALIGIYWFKKNKPTISKSQAKGIQALSNYYETGSGGFEETFIKGQGAYTPPMAGEITIGGVKQSLLANVDYTKLTPKQLEDLKNSIGVIPDPSNMVSNQIAQNMQNVDFSSFANLGLTGVTFNVPKK
jgi:hypothetical protein